MGVKTILRIACRNQKVTIKKLENYNNLSYLFTEFSWHIIFGGNGLYETLDSVELFNWKTGEQCFLKELPFRIAAHTGAVMDDVPVFCGGFTTESEAKCFKLNKTSQYWNQVGILFLYQIKIIEHTYKESYRQKKVEKV